MCQNIGGKTDLKLIIVDLLVNGVREQTVAFGHASLHNI